jgi:hypothetical protein
MYNLKGALKINIEHNLAITTYASTYLLNNVPRDRNVVVKNGFLLVLREKHGKNKMG